MTESDHFFDGEFEPFEDSIWGVEYGLDVLVAGDRTRWDNHRAVLRLTGDIEDALARIRKAWIGKTLYSPGCNALGCHCGGKEQTAKVLGIKFYEVKVIARLTDLDAVVAHAISQDKEKDGPYDDGEDYGDA